MCVYFVRGSGCGVYLSITRGLNLRKILPVMEQHTTTYIQDISMFLVKRKYGVYSRRFTILGGKLSRNVLSSKTSKETKKHALWSQKKFPFG